LLKGKGVERGTFKDKLRKEKKLGSSTVVNTYNPSNSGGRGRRIIVQSQPQSLSEKQTKKQKECRHGSSGTALD
jgi:hypothetical protein